MRVPAWQLGLCLGFLFTITPIASQREQQRSAEVSGTVLRGGGGGPVPEVTVRLTSPVGLSFFADSDRNGKFQISGVSPGVYTLSYGHKGMVPVGRSTPTTLRLAPGETISTLRLELAPAPVIAGRVFDENGQPKALAHVVAAKPRYVHGKRHLDFSLYPTDGGSDWGRTQTNAKGEYRISGLEPGEYYVSAEEGDMWFSRRRYYPDAVDPADAVTVALQPGTDASGIDFRPSMKDLHTARFRIVDASSSAPGSPRFSLTIMRLSRGGLETIESSVFVANPAQPPALFKSLEENVYSVDLPAGSYDLYYASSLARTIGKLSFTIANRDIDAGALSVRASHRVEGQILSPNSTLPNRLGIIFRPLDRWADAYNTTNMPEPYGYVLAGNRFSHPSIPEGRYELQIRGLPPEFYIASARHGAIDVRESAFEVSAGDISPLEITVARGATVNGTVRNAVGAAVADSRVALIPMSASRRTLLRFYKNVLSDQDGEFSIEGVAPGDYSVLAWQSVETGAWLNPDFLSQFDSRSTKITVSGTSSNAGTIRVIPADK
jgi:hypothetical protein